MGDPVCHEEVTRKGWAQPCEKPAVAMRIDPNEGTPYPVCVKHTRDDMVPLAAPDELTALREKADWDEWACKKNQELFRQASDERDALRERIRRHVDQWLDAGSSPDAHGLGDSIRDLLGDS